MTADSTATRPWFCPRGETCPAGTHDDYSAYRKGCRSGAATEDRRLYNKRWREGRNPPRLVNALGLARRIQACYAVGYTGGELAAALGVSRSRVAEMRTAKFPRAYVARAERIVPILEQMAMQPPPWSPVRLKSRRWAGRQGFRHLLAWDDVDDPNEQPPGAPDIDEQIDELAELGVSLRQIAKKLDLSYRQVERRRQGKGRAELTVDEHVFEAVLAGRRRLAEVNLAEQDHVVSRLWRHYTIEGWERPGLKIAERLEADYAFVEKVRARITARELRERKEAS